MLAISGTVYAILRIARDRDIPVASQQELVQLWLTKDYSGISAACDLALQDDPLDSFRLVFKGMSSFYLGLAEIDGEKRSTLMDTAVFSIRKALLDPKAPLRPQAMYVLGKAYFHKGQDYWDETMTYLREASGAGYTAADTWEYLALAAQGIGQTQESIAFFEKAMTAKPGSPELMLAAAVANGSAGNQARSEELALAALSTTADEYLAERCNFMLGESYRKAGRFTEAMARYEAIKEKNPQSADAWFYEGLVLLDTGDPIKARAAWRKAVSIDPMHPGARQKLSERS
jgi:tetratricopeptide (TPR) repeat protein